MTAFQPGPRYSAAAGADLSSKQYYIVKLDASGNVVLASSATDPILGVLANAPKQGMTADVVLINSEGTFKVKTNGSTVISKDAYITSDASGLAVATTTTGNRVLGRAMRTTAVNEVAEYIKANEKY